MSMAKLCRAWRGCHLDRRGTTTGEFALVLPVFLLFVLGTMDFGRLYWMRATLQDGVDTAARTAMVTSYSGGAASTLQSACNTRIQALGMSSYSACSATAISGNTAVTITATESFAFVYGMMPQVSITLTGTTSAPFGPY
jgi:Flp pilus assembly protein TadG